MRSRWVIATTPANNGTKLERVSGCRRCVDARQLVTLSRLEQRQRVGADADGAGLAPFTQEPNVAAFIQRLNVLPPQMAQLGDTTAQQVGPTDHDVVPRCDG